MLKHLIIERFNLQVAEVIERSEGREVVFKS
jgi:hypothetical protein